MIVPIGRVWSGLRLTAVGIVMSAGACTSGPADGSSATSGLPPTASIHELMVSVIDPAADTLWKSVATIVTDRGAEERQPRSQEDWDSVRSAAVRLVESSHLLLMSDEDVAREDPEAWNRLVADFSRVSVTMLDAIERRDVDRLFDEGGPLDLTCAGCHRRYWDSEDDAQRRIPSMQRDEEAAAPPPR